MVPMREIPIYIYGAFIRFEIRRSNGVSQIIITTLSR